MQPVDHIEIDLSSYLRASTLATGVFDGAAPAAYMRATLPFSILIK
jgi:hypothetical protein